MMGDMKDRKGDVKYDLIWKHFVKYYFYWCRIRVSLPSYGSLIYELLGLGRNTRKLDWEGYRIRLVDVGVRTGKVPTGTLSFLTLFLVE